MVAILCWKNYTTFLANVPEAIIGSWISTFANVPIHSFSYNGLGSCKTYENRILDLKFTLNFSVRILLETAFVPINIWRAALGTWSQKRIGLHVKCPLLLSECNQSCTKCQITVKLTNIGFHETEVLRLWTDRDAEDKGCIIANFYCESTKRKGRYTNQAIVGVLFMRYFYPRTYIHI